MLLVHGDFRIRTEEQHESLLSEIASGFLDRLPLLSLYLLACVNSGHWLRSTHEVRKSYLFAGEDILLLY